MSGISRKSIAIRESKLLRFHHLVNEIRASPLHRAKIEALRDRQLLEKDVTLRDGRLADHAQSSVLDRDRLGVIRAMGREIASVDGATDRGDAFDEARAEIATVEHVGSVPCDRAQRRAAMHRRRVHPLSQC